MISQKCENRVVRDAITLCTGSSPAFYRLYGLMENKQTDEEKYPNKNNDTHQCAIPVCYNAAEVEEIVHGGALVSIQVVGYFALWQILRN